MLENFTKTSFADLKKDAEEKGPEAKKFLKDMVVEGKSYLTIKKAYFKTYYPDLVPVAKPKPKSIIGGLGLTRYGKRRIRGVFFFSRIFIHFLTFLLNNHHFN